MKFHILGFAIAFLLTISPMVHAAPVAITNAGFESPVLADGAQSSSAAGWTRFGSARFTNPTASQFTGEAYEGQNVALFTGGATLTQIMGTIGYGTYTLTAAIGDPLGASLSGLNLSLRKGTSFLSPSSTSFLPPADGGYSVYSRVYEVTPDNANGTFFGDPFNIFALVSSSSGQVAMDDIRLDFSPAPEPASLALLALGLAGLGFSGRRKSFQA